MIGRFSDLDLFVSLVFKIEPSTVAFSKAPMAVSEAAVSWASFANLVSAANASSPESKITTSSLVTSVASYFGALHVRQAALRWT